MTISFELKNIEFTWKNKKEKTLSIDKISFSSHSNGQMLPIIGESGSGKSTLLFLLAGFKRPDAGSVIWELPSSDKKVCWDNHNNNLKRNELINLYRKDFGFAYQKSTLTPFMNIKENLIYPMRLNGISKRDAEEKAKTILNKILKSNSQDETENKDYVSGFLKHFPHQLSGGEAHRAALAQAWVNNPTVFFADEPTSNLDMKNRKNIMKLICDWLAANSNRLFIWVSHHREDEKTPYLLVENKVVKLIT